MKTYIYVLNWFSENSLALCKTSNSEWHCHYPAPLKPVEVFYHSLPDSKSHHEVRHQRYLNYRPLNEQRRNHITDMWPEVFKSGDGCYDRLVWFVDVTKRPCFTVSVQRVENKWIFFRELCVRIERRLRLKSAWVLLTESRRRSWGLLYLLVASRMDSTLEV